jgi:hypothetical protein
MNVTETRCESVDWNQPDQDRILLQGLVKNAMIFRFHKKAKHLFNN